ncbi:hypothetical protein ACFU8Q_14420 [Streptomyces sp. NPDC057543]|uniref:hypothetical protein n=1 Tax=Streptomyces sp. NPDC057543 TaxID=3346163 RepID=UPI0036BDC7C3
MPQQQPIAGRHELLEPLDNGGMGDVWRGYADIGRLQHESDLLAERCLLFIACTRARGGLHVSWSGAGTPSEFLVQAGVCQAS